MDSETIRITISPLFFLTSVSLTIGMFAGIIIGLTEDTLKALLIIFITAFGNSALILIPYYVKRRKLKSKGTKNTEENFEESKLNLHKEFKF